MAKRSPHTPFDLLGKDYIRDPLHWWNNLNNKITKESLWIDACYNPSWVGEELRRTGLAMSTQAQHVELCEDNEKIPHDRALLCEAASFVTLLRACSKKKDLYTGTKVHHDVLKLGLLEQCSDALVTMYAKCGALAKAKELMDMHKSRDLFSWTDLIAGYARKRQGHDALHYFTRMQHEGLSPNAATFTCILKACGSIKAVDKGEQIHDEIVRRGLLGNDIVLGNALVDMYAKCGALAKARRVLDELPVRDVVSWSTMITGYTQLGQGEQALDCFERMQREGLSPDAVTFACILKACGSIGAVDKGEQIHDEITKQGLLGKDVVLGNALVDMYAKCGALAKAKRVLEELPMRDVFSWSALIAGYAQLGQGAQALKCFEQMQHEGLSPDSVTFSCVLNACGSIRAADKGEQIHDEIARQGLLKHNIVLGNALVDMYAKCGALAKAQQVLEELPTRDVVSWSALIAGYAQQGQGEQALNCFEQMHREGVSPNAVTFVCILKACGSIGAVVKGEQIYGEIARQGLLGDNVVLGNAVVDMYAKCNALMKAQGVLEELPVQNAVSWNTLIAGYAQQGKAEDALKCFEWMQRKGLSPDVVTFLCILKACAIIGAADMGERIHDEIARLGLLRSNIVLGNALVDMYAKCGTLAKARWVLEELPHQDVISWNALIAGYTEQGQLEEALTCFERMQHDGLSPDSVTFLCILKACGSIGAAGKGEQIYDQIARQGLIGNDIVLGTAVVDMYAKCGALAKAAQVFEELPIHNVVSWNALIVGYAEQGQHEQALICFKRMQDEGLSPDAVTLECILKAYSILGLVDDAEKCFVNMSTKYGIRPDLEHCTCMVDVLGRAGYIDKAVAVIQKMPSFDYSVALWLALLSACWKWGGVNVGRRAFERAVQLDRTEAAAHVLTTNIYAAAGMQKHAGNIEALRMEEAIACNLHAVNGMDGMG